MPLYLMIMAYGLKMIKVPHNLGSRNDDLKRYLEIMILYLVMPGSDTGSQNWLSVS